MNRTSGTQFWRRSRNAYKKCTGLTAHLQPLQRSPLLFNNSRTLRFAGRNRGHLRSKHCEVDWPSSPPIPPVCVCKAPELPPGSQYFDCCRAGLGIVGTGQCVTEFSEKTRGHCLVACRSKQYPLLITLPIHIPRDLFCLLHQYCRNSVSAKQA